MAYEQTTIAAPAQRGYFTETQAPIYSAALVLPFLLVYQIGLVILRSRVINGGDAIVSILSHRLFRAVGVELSFASVLVPIVAFAIWQYRRKGTWSLQPPLLLATFFESLIYAVVLFMLLGYFVQYLPGVGEFRVPNSECRMPGSATPAPNDGDASQTIRNSKFEIRNSPVFMASRSRGSAHRPGIEDFVLYCGAGVYEELVFRVFLLGLLMLVFTKLFHMEHAYAAAWSTLAGAVIFSAFHHIGGEPFAMGPFVQRIIAGIYFSALYFTRSFGVAAASHAMYDIIVGLEQWHG